MKRMDPQKRAFTLVEMLVVILLIAVLIAILLPALARAREMARAVTCASNLRQFGVAFVNYATQMNGVMPPIVGWYQNDPDGPGPLPAVTAPWGCNIIATIQPYLGAASALPSFSESSTMTGYDNEVFRDPGDTFNSVQQAGYSYAMNYCAPYQVDSTAAPTVAADLDTARTDNRDFCPFSTLNVVATNTTYGETKFYGTSAADTFLMTEYAGIDQSSTSTGISYLQLDSPDKLVKGALRQNAYTGDTARWFEFGGSRTLQQGNSMQQWPFRLQGIVGFRYAYHRGRANFLFMDGHVDGLEVLNVAGKTVPEVANWTGLMD